MSLSPKDDPRTWLVPGPRAVSRPPLNARLLYYDLTANERALLLAMCEVSKDGLGNGCWASLETYAFHSDLSVKTVWNLIHGRKYKNGRRIIGLIDRRILIERAAAKTQSRRRRQWHTVPAIYDINEAALALKPEILASLEDGVQQTIPGIPRPPRPSQPVEFAPEHPAPGAGSTRHQVHDHPAPGADDTKAFDSKTLDTKPREGESIDDPPRAREVQNAPPPKYSQADFDARDMRKMAEAGSEAEKRPSSVGSLSDKAYFEWICAHAGITVQRGLHLQQLQVSWPETHLPAIPDQRNQLEINRAMQECRDWDAARAQNGNREK